MLSGEKLFEIQVVASCERVFGFFDVFDDVFESFDIVFRQSQPSVDFEIRKLTVFSKGILVSHYLPKRGCERPYLVDLCHVLFSACPVHVLVEWRLQGVQIHYRLHNRIIWLEPQRGHVDGLLRIAEVHHRNKLIKSSLVLRISLVQMVVVIVHALFFEDVQVRENETIYQLVYRWVLEPIFLKVDLSVLVAEVLTASAARFWAIALPEEAVIVLVLQLRRPLLIQKRRKCAVGLYLISGGPWLDEDIECWLVPLVVRCSVDPMEILRIFVLVHYHVLQVNRKSSVNREYLVVLRLLVVLALDRPVYSVAKALGGLPLLVNEFDGNALNV